MSPTWTEARLFGRFLVSSVRWRDADTVRAVSYPTGLDQPATPLRAAEAERGREMTDARQGASARCQHLPKIWLWCLSGGRRSLGFSLRTFYLQIPFLEWRDPDSNRGTMIFRHSLRPSIIRQTRIGKRISVHRVPSDTSWFYGCATVDTSFRHFDWRC